MMFLKDTIETRESKNSVVMINPMPKSPNEKK
jgi:hypothetical protein